MRRRILSIIAITLLAVIISPYIMGYLAEEQVKRMVEAIPASWGVDVKLKKYKRGWFYSKANFDLTIPRTNIYQIFPQRYLSPLLAEGESMNQPFTLELNSHIIHGPFIMDFGNLNDLHLNLGQAMIKSELAIHKQDFALVKQFLNVTTLLEGKTLVKFNGSSNSTFKSPNLSYQDEQRDFELNMSGLAVIWDLSRNFNKLTGNTQIDELTTTENNVSLSLSNLVFKHDFDKSPEKLWLGESSISLPFITLSVDGKERLISMGLMFTSNNTITGNVYNSVINIDLEKLIFNEVSYGPASTRISIKNLDAVALSDIRNLIGQYHSFGNSEADLEHLYTKVSKRLPRLLGHGFQVHITPLVFQTPEGEISMQAWLTLPNKHKQKGVGVELNQLFQNSDASFNIAVPKPYVNSFLESFLRRKQQYIMAAGSKSKLSSGDEMDEQIQEKLNNWVDSSYLVAEPSLYSLSVDYKREQFFINGKPLDEIISAQEQSVS